MIIAGLQKMTLLDFPGRVACTIFLQGCNFRCPFCHNSDLLERQGNGTIPVEELLSFLRKRQGLLDGVCITGGEPTLQPDLEDFVRQIKALGYPVKLDTNGGRPDVLKRLVGEGLIDYVAMDIKNSPARYGETVGLSKVDMEAIDESIRFLLSDAVAYEFRTTVVAQLHDDASILEMGTWLSSLLPGKKPAQLFLQKFVDRDTVIFSGLSAPDEEQMKGFVSLLAPFVEKVAIRGT